MEDDFYATVKFKNGEEIFAKISASEEEERTMLIVSNPIVVSEIRNKVGPIGYRLEPWLKTTEEDMFVVDKADVLTLSESSDEEMIGMYNSFLEKNSGKRFHGSHYKLGKSMGYVSTVNEAKTLLEKIYKQTPKPKES
tara:strand:- start:340 stop:753 length:414 start_codon:yes stop_codon:yes gene_type:complete